MTKLGRRHRPLAHDEITVGQWSDMVNVWNRITTPRHRLAAECKVKGHDWRRVIDIEHPDHRVEYVICARCLKYDNEQRERLRGVKG